MQKEYNPVSCDHKLDNGFTAWMFQSEEQGNFPGTGFKVFVHVCKNCGEISVGGRREDSHGKVNYFDEHFDIHHPDAIDAIIKQANFYNEEVKWQRVPAPPASALEEADKLYPPDPGNDDWYTDGQVSAMQQQAHIRCAGMYTDTIDKLKAENSKMVNKDQVKELFRHFCLYKNNGGEKEFNDWLDAPPTHQKHFQ